MPGQPKASEGMVTDEDDDRTEADRLDGRGEQDGEVQAGGELL